MDNMINRRKFLLSATGLIASTAILSVSYRLFSPLHLRLDTSYPLGSLSEQEMQTIIALAETLFPSDIKTPDFFVKQYVNTQTKNKKGYLKAYRESIALLNIEAKNLFGENKIFYGLALLDRNKVLDNLLGFYKKNNYKERTRERLEKIFVSERVRVLRSFVIKPLLKAFYESPYGWAVVGYDSFPGHPGQNAKAYAEAPQHQQKVF